MEDPHISILDPGYFMAQIKRPDHQMIDITEKKKEQCDIRRYTRIRITETGSKAKS